MLLEEFLENSAERLPDKVALVSGRERLCYGEIERRANILANGLIRCGLERGDRVGIHLENGWEAAVSLFAVLKAGGVFCFVHPTAKSEQLGFVLRDCRARGLIAHSSKLPSTASVAATAPHLAFVVLAGTGPDRAPAPGVRVLALDEAIESPRGVARPQKRRIDVDLAALVYTSGSTGVPKGVMLTHLNMVSAATSITTYLENVEEDVVLNALPLSFDYGLYQVLMACRVGARLVLERSFTYPHQALGKIALERVTGLPIVPTMLAILLQLDLSKYDLASLRYVTNTGAALPVEHIRKLRRLLPQARIFSMYGLSECKRVAYLRPEWIDSRPDSVGKAMPNVETYIVDEEGRPCGPGEIGELVVRGANVMQGYWERPEETAEVLRPGPPAGEPVLYTGDLFRADEEGFLYFVGRRDDMLKSRGEKVSPKEIENVLHAMDGVAEAAVIGAPDPVLGQAIVAFVVPFASAALDPDSVRAHCARHLEDYKVPRFVEVLSDLPKTGNGKVDRIALSRRRE